MNNIRSMIRSMDKASAVERIFYGISAILVGAISFTFNRIGLGIMFPGLQTIDIAFGIDMNEGISLSISLVQFLFSSSRQSYMNTSLIYAAVVCYFIGIGSNAVGILSVGYSWQEFVDMTSPVGVGTVKAALVVLVTVALSIMLDAYPEPAMRVAATGESPRDAFRHFLELFGHGGTQYRAPQRPQSGYQQQHRTAHPQQPNPRPTRPTVNVMGVRQEQRAAPPQPSSIPNLNGLSEEEIDRMIEGVD